MTNSNNQQPRLRQWQVPSPIVAELHMAAGQNEIQDLLPLLLPSNNPDAFVANANAWAAGSAQAKDFIHAKLAYAQVLMLDEIRKRQDRLVALNKRMVYGGAEPADAGVQRMEPQPGPEMVDGPMTEEEQMAADMGLGDPDDMDWGAPPPQQGVTQLPPQVAAAAQAAAAPAPDNGVGEVIDASGSDADVPAEG